jgi:hypothetical protein
MRTVVIGAETIDAVKWPSCCIRCGQDFSIETSTNPPARDLSNDAVISTLREQWKRRDTEDLLEVWVKNSDEEWRPETFQVISKILQERKIALPTQRQKAPVPVFLIDIPIEKKLTILLLASTPKKIPVRFCQRCGPRAMSSGKLLRTLAGIVLLTTIFGPILGNFAFGSSYRENPDGQGASFGLFLLLAWIGSRKQWRDIGIRVKRISKEQWKFSFRSEDVASEFSRLNQTLLLKG